MRHYFEFNLLSFVLLCVNPETRIKYKNYLEDQVLHDIFFVEIKN